MSALPPTLPPKKDVLLALLERSSVYLHLDPRAEPVRVPSWFKKQPQLILQIGLNLPVPIRDLEVDDAGVSCTLSFSRTPHFCLLPWVAIYAIVGEDGRGMVWPDDVPREVAAQQKAQVRQDKEKKRKRRLRAVGAEEPADRDDAAGSNPPPDQPTVASERAPDPPDTRAAKAAPEAQPTPEEPIEDGHAGAPTSEGADDGARAPTPKAGRLPPYLRVVK